MLEQKCEISHFLICPMFCQYKRYDTRYDTKLRNEVANISNKVAIYKNLLRIINKNIINKTNWGSVNRFWFIDRRDNTFVRETGMTIMTSFDSLQT